MSPFGLPFSTSLANRGRALERSGKLKFLPRRTGLAAAVLALGAVVCPVGAQMPGAPVLQNAWASPGIVIAGNFASGSGSLYGAAVGWSPGSGRFQLSGGAGMNNPKGVAGSRAVYGARVAFPIAQMMAGKLGIAGFAGVGGGAAKSSEPTATRTHAPVGVGIGYRQAIGTAGRGFSAYVDPMYQFHRGASENKGYFRVAGGLDLGISPRFGVTLGFESGATAKAGEVGPTGGLFGVGVSMKLGR